jgi:hypothetical protein
MLYKLQNAFLLAYDKLRKNDKISLCRFGILKPLNLLK